MSNKFTKTELLEAKKQLMSVRHKTKQTVQTLSSKENVDRYKSQITLSNRRIEAFELSLELIDKEIAKLD